MLGQIGSSAGLSNGDEMIVLFFWDRTSDLVLDIDYVVYGNTSDAADKSGIMSGASTYADDVSTSLQSVALAPGFRLSCARIDNSEGTEDKAPVGGGNGFLGHNEMSENLSTTWVVGTPTPGT